ncbi:MAG: hypothetical protein ABI967_13125 [bacterium]
MGKVGVRHRGSVSVSLSHVLSTRLALITVICAFLLSCETPDKPQVEAPPATVVQADQPKPAQSLPPADLRAVQEAVGRVFKDTVVLDPSRNPNFIAGDFNGDGSPDIAVVLKPAPESLSALNEEFPTWILRDLSASDQSHVPRLRVAANEVLLAVIHGYGADGWRDPQATQTYLIKNAVGSGLKKHQAKEVTAANQRKTMPRLNGDVISEVLGGTSGYVYYAGATYAWYDPKTFKGDPEPGMFHGMADRKVKK